MEAVDCMTFPDSGRFRGIAILTFATREAAKGALAWNGEEWDGTFLTVKKYARKRGGRTPRTAARTAAPAAPAAARREATSARCRKPRASGWRSRAT